MRSRSKSRSTIRNFTRQSIPTTCRSSSARQRDAASGAEAISAPCSLSDDGLQKPRRDLVASFWVTNGKQNDGVPSDKSLEATATNGAAHPATSRAMPAILIRHWYLAARQLAKHRDYTGAADKAVNLVGCKSPHHQLPGRVVSRSDACGGNEACSARMSKPRLPCGDKSQRWERSGRGAVDNAANLARCKSLRRQLPVFGRLAYPVRAEATKHVLPGCKSLGCPAALCAAVGTTWETSKLGGLNIKKCLQPRKHPPREVVFADRSGKPTQTSLGEGR